MNESLIKSSRADVLNELHNRPDEATASSVDACLFLGISLSSLKRLRSDDFGPPYIQYSLGQSTSPNQKIQYVMGDLRKWRNDRKVTSALDAANRRFTYENVFELTDHELDLQDNISPTLTSRSMLERNVLWIDCKLENIASPLFFLTPEELSRILRFYKDVNIYIVKWDEALTFKWSDDSAFEATLTPLVLGL